MAVSFPPSLPPLPHSAMLQSSAMNPAAGAPPSDHAAAALHHGPPHGLPTSGPAGFSPAAAAAAYQGCPRRNHIDTMILIYVSYVKHLHRLHLHIIFIASWPSIEECAWVLSLTVVTLVTICLNIRRQPFTRRSPPSVSDTKNLSAPPLVPPPLQGIASTFECEKVKYKCQMEFWTFLISLYFDRIGY